MELSIYMINPISPSTHVHELSRPPVAAQAQGTAQKNNVPRENDTVTLKSTGGADRDGDNA